MNLLEEWHIEKDLFQLLAGDVEEEPWTMVPGVYYRESPHFVMKGDDGQRKEVRPARQMCRARLAEITTNRMNLERIKENMNEDRRRWLEWLKGETIGNYINITDKQKGKNTYVGRYMTQERERLQHWRVIEDATTAGITVPIFKVPKGEEARLIVDCRSINERIPRPGNMELPNLHDVYDGLLECDWVAQYDGKSYFYQVPLEESAREYFQVRLGGARGEFTKHQLTVLPMGYSYAPGIAQAISNTILEEVSVSEPNVRMYAWIDNFLFGSKDRDALLRATKTFKDICARYNVELKDERTEPAREMEALGACIKVGGEKGIRPGSKLMTALQKEESETRGKTALTRRDVFRIMGKLLWVYWAIVRKPLAACERILDAMRSVAKEIRDGASWDTTTFAISTQNAVAEIEVARRRAETFQWRQKGKSMEIVAWTDASSSGLGYMMTRNGGDALGWASRGPPSSTFVRELWAAAKMVVAVSNRGGGVIVVDNQAAIRALVAGHSSSKAGNAILRQMFGRMGGDAIEITWTESANQSADELSRGLAVTLPKYGPWRQRHRLRWWPQ